MKHIPVSTAIGLTACSLWSGANAQQTQAPPSDGPAKDIGMVVVTGERPTSLPTQIPTTMESATRADIERTVNATDSEDP
jgi:iron complex outermembrane receptor protein